MIASNYRRNPQVLDPKISLGSNHLAHQDTNNAHGYEILSKLSKINPVFPILLILSALWWYKMGDGSSPDLMASWLAGKYYNAGLFDQIYPHDTDLFVMRPPPQWVSDLQASGYQGEIYPFIYPPIWAYVAGLLNHLTTYEVFFSVAGFVNPLLLGTTVWLAVRMFAEKSDVLRIVMFTLLLLGTSLPAIIALIQNQPQILVTFLIVLAVERTRAGSPVIGGIAMAFAASLKLYPAIFVLFWWAQGEKSAVKTFLAFGGALAVLSVTLTGWTLHIEFLNEMRVISGSVLLTVFTLSLDPLIANLFFVDQMLFVKELVQLHDGETAPGWSIMTKPLGWRIADMVLLAAVVFSLYRSARSEHGRDALFWPMSFTVLALVSPLSWGYHYLPALAFAGVLLCRWPVRQAVIALFTVFFPLSVYFLSFVVPIFALETLVQPLSTIALAIYACFMWLAIGKRASIAGSPLRAPQPRL